VEIPVITLAPPLDPAALSGALLAIESYDWLVFTSANAVHAVAHARAIADAALPEHLRIASVGEATSAAVREAWPESRIDVEAATPGGEGVVAAFADVDLRGRRALLPVSDRAASTVERGLAARGAHVFRVIAYRTIEAPGFAERLAQERTRGFDLVAFASPSAVEALLLRAPDVVADRPVVVIGPTTGDAARRAGLTVVAQAHPSTMEGLAEAISRSLASGP
jgi:uroporphyrinogen-III synthase